MALFQRRSLLALLVIAAALRIVTLESRTLEYDDAFSVLLAARPLGQIVAGTAADTMPPLYYFALHAWMSVSRQIWFLRTLNVLLSLGVVWLVSLWVMNLFGSRAGWWAGLFTAVSPLQIFHAQGMRMYVLLALSLVAHAWFFTRLWKSEFPYRQRWWDWVGLVLSGTLALYSHNLAVFSLLSLGAFLLLRREWRNLGRLILAQLASAILALPWLILVPTQVTKVQNAFWTPRPGPLEIVQMLVTFHTNLPVPTTLVPVVVATSVLVTVLVGVEIWRSGRWDPGVGLLIILALAPPAMLFLVSYAMRPVFLPRPVMFSSLAYYGLVGWAVGRARGPSGWLVAAAFALPALAALPSQFSYTRFPRSPFRQTAAYLQEMVAMEGLEVVVHDNKLSYFPMHLLAPELPQNFLPDAPGSPNDTLATATQAALNLFPTATMQEAVGSATRIWFVVFERSMSEYQVSAGTAHPQLAWLEGRYSLAGRHVFQDLFVYEYIRREP